MLGVSHCKLLCFYCICKLVFFAILLEERWDVKGRKRKRNLSLRWVGEVLPTWLGGRGGGNLHLTNIIFIKSFGFLFKCNHANIYVYIYISFSTSILQSEYCDSIRVVREIFILYFAKYSPNFAKWKRWNSAQFCEILCCEINIYQNFAKLKCHQLQRNKFTNFQRFQQVFFMFATECSFQHFTNIEDLKYVKISDT